MSKINGKITFFEKHLTSNPECVKPADTPVKRKVLKLKVPDIFGPKQDVTQLSKSTNDLTSVTKTHCIPGSKSENNIADKVNREESQSLGKQFYKTETLTVESSDSSNKNGTQIYMRQNSKNDGILGANQQIRGEYLKVDSDKISVEENDKVKGESNIKIYNSILEEKDAIREKYPLRNNTYVEKLNDKATIEKSPNVTEALKLKPRLKDTIVRQNSLLITMEKGSYIEGQKEENLYINKLKEIKSKRSTTDLGPRSLVYNFTKNWQSTNKTQNYCAVEDTTSFKRSAVTIENKEAIPGMKKRNAVVIPNIFMDNKEIANNVPISKKTINDIKKDNSKKEIRTPVVSISEEPHETMTDNDTYRKHESYSEDEEPVFDNTLENSAFSSVIKPYKIEVDNSMKTVVPMERAANGNQTDNFVKNTHQSIPTPAPRRKLTSSSSTSSQNNINEISPMARMRYLSQNSSISEDDYSNSMPKNPVEALYSNILTIENVLVEINQQNENATNTVPKPAPRLRSLSQNVTGQVNTSENNTTSPPIISPRKKLFHSESEISSSDSCMQKSKYSYENL